MLVHDASLGIGAEREFADLHLESRFFGLSFSQAHAADLRLTVGASRNMVLVDWLGGLACDFGDHHNAAHAGDVSKLRQSGHDVTNSVGAFFTGFPPMVYVNIRVLNLDACT